MRLFDELALARDGARRRLAAASATTRPSSRRSPRERALPPEPRGAHPRVQILGLLEARLLDVDRVVLGGLDEGIWPPTAETDAFLNRPMRLELGLSPPERRIGQTAHDFVQALGTPDAILTRARKRDGKPTVPSRFLERLRAFAGDDAGRRALGARRALSAASPRRSMTPRPVRAARAGPRRGRAARAFPRRLSVTEIETLVRDPYSIFARHILRLEPLDPVGGLPARPSGARSCTTCWRTSRAAIRATCRPDARTSSCSSARSRFRRHRGSLSRALRALVAGLPALRPAFLAWERTRRRAVSAIHVERSGAARVPARARATSFTLRGRADRIEIGRDGAAAIVDFKTAACRRDEGGGGRLLAAADAGSRDAGRGGVRGTCPPAGTRRRCTT